ncbi:RelA/SpoT family protein [bacterium]|nr:RelA/SpoT family protein [bacterium]
MVVGADGPAFASVSGEATLQSLVTINDLLARTPADSRDLVAKAYEVAERLHTGQVRRSGEPYINHPLMVAYYLADLNMDGPSIAAGLLHDVLEDTGMTREELAEHFPEPVPSIVQGVTKISRISFQTNRDAQVENLRLMILAMAQDIRVVIVKLCDRLHNMKTLKSMPPEKQIKISEETMDIYAPLANRLGMSRIKSELEDLAMRWILPDDYRRLRELVSTRRAEREAIVEESISFLRNYLGKFFPNLQITGRPKHFYSIFKKMKEQGLSFDQIHDLNALRVICEEENQCYAIMGMIHSVWHPIPGRIKDYIGMPKKNMYQSIHTTVIGYKGVRTEVQIRTRSMHSVAEFGIAAHWKYKEANTELKMDERLAWLRQLTEWITDLNEPSGLLDALKKDVFADRVMCFTPKGDVIELPAHATPIDFAYAIHTRVGDKCIGARINDRMVNLRHRLENGDVVDIITSTMGHPSRDWLDHVVTGRAKQKIKHWLKERNTGEWIESGRRAVVNLLKERNIAVQQGELDAALASILSVYKLQTVNDLLMEIGFGSISAVATVARMNPEWAKPAKRRGARKPGTGEPKKKPASEGSGGIIVDGLDGVPIRLPACCSPIPGDPIMGYVTRGRGVTVHQLSCRTVQRALKDEEEAPRLHAAHWAVGEGRVHPVSLRIVSEDRTGLLNDVSSILSKHNIFIDGCKTKSDHRRGIATLIFDVNVRDVSEVDTVLKAIQQREGTISADRRRRGDSRLS